MIFSTGSSAKSVQLQYQGVDSLYLKNGRLVVTTSLNETWEEKPVAWQIINGKKKKVSCKYQLSGDTLSYIFPNGYNEEYELIIDPSMVFSSYSGSTAQNHGYTATYDKFGFLYSGSSAFALGYPVTIGAYQTNWAGGNGGGGNGGSDIALTKWDTTGTNLIYSTYLGGTSDEIPHSLFVTEYSELYVMATTGSSDFPTTNTAFDTSFNKATPLIPVDLTGSVGVYYANGSDLVISKFDSTGSQLKGSTFLGGTKSDGLNTGINKFNYSDEFRGEIKIDAKGKVYIASCTRSSDNPTTSLGFQTSKPSIGTEIDGVLYKLDNKLENLEWTNYIGGDSSDAVFSVDFNSLNEVYITGGTRSSNFPVTHLSYDTSYADSTDAFLMHISESGQQILHSTFVGTNGYDQAFFVDVDFENNPHIFGQTSAASGLMISNANYNDPLGGQFITKFKPELDSAIWSTRFGTGRGVPDISPSAFMIDKCSGIYTSGWASLTASSNLTSTGLDIINSPFQSTTDGQDFYVMVLSADANSLVYGTFVGAVSPVGDHVNGGTNRFDPKGNLYQAVCAGCGNFSTFPTHPNPGAWSNTNNSTYFLGCNLAVFKLDFEQSSVIADFDFPTTGCVPFTINFDNISKTYNQSTYLWDFGDQSTSTSFEPSHTYYFPGTYTITLLITDPLSCNMTDSITHTITVLENGSDSLSKVYSCTDNPVPIGITNNYDPSLTITWSPTNYLNDSTISNPMANPPHDMLYTLIIDNSVCADTLTQWVEVDSVSVDLVGEPIVCMQDAPFKISSTHSGNIQSYLWSDTASFSDTLLYSSIQDSLWFNPTDSLTTIYLRVTTQRGCEAIDSFQLMVNDLTHPITANFTFPTEVCAPEIINFTNTSDSLSGTQYAWDFGNGYFSTQSNPSSFYNSKGNFSITLIAIDSSICPQTDTISLDLIVKEDSNYSVSALACLGQETQIGILPDTSSTTQYHWYPSSNLSDSTISNPTTTVWQDTSYLLVVNHTCSDSIKNNIQVSKIFAQTDSLLISCSDVPGISITGKSQGTGNQFIWSSNINFSDTLNASTTDSIGNFSNAETYSTYYLKVINPDGCEETDSVRVVISDQTISLSNSEYICKNDTVNLTATNNFPYNTQSFYWSPIDSIIGSHDTNTITVNPSHTLMYFVTAVNDSGCTYYDSIPVTVSPIYTGNVKASASPDSIISGFETQLQATSFTNYLYQWTPSQNLSNPNSESTAANVYETTTFFVQITDPQNQNCTAVDEVTVIAYEINCGEPDIFIPNAFSPNLDGENDEFRISGNVIQNIELEIYNRWGQMVFQSTELNQSWDGTFNGKPVDPSVFMYVLKVECIDLREFSKKGNITVIR